MVVHLKLLELQKAFAGGYVTNTFIFRRPSSSTQPITRSINMPAPYDLFGRTAIVTGSSTGNGRAIAVSLAEAGVNSE